MKSVPQMRPAREYAARSIDGIDRYLAARVKQARSLRGVSRQRLATMTGYSLGQMEKWENAENRLSAAQLHTIALVLEVEPGWFYQGYDQAGAFKTVDDDVASNLFAQRLLTLFRRMSPEQQAISRKQMEMFADANELARTGMQAPPEALAS